MKNSVYNLKIVNAVYTMRAEQVLWRNDSDTLEEFKTKHLKHSISNLFTNTHKSNFG